LKLKWKARLVGLADFSWGRSSDFGTRGLQSFNPAKGDSSLPSQIEFLTGVEVISGELSKAVCVDSVLTIFGGVCRETKKF
jgi:hypothetical protein